MINGSLGQQAAHDWQAECANFGPAAHELTRLCDGERGLDFAVVHPLNRSTPLQR